MKVAEAANVIENTQRDLSIALINLIAMIFSRNYIYQVDVFDPLVTREDVRDFRAGDVRHSLANISKARHLLNYAPTHQVKAGIKETVS